MNIGNPNWLSTHFQARSNTPSIPINRAVAETVNKCDIIKIKMIRDPAAADSETCDLKISMFKYRKPEEFLKMMNNFKTEIDGTGTTTAAGKTFTYVPY